MSNSESNLRYQVNERPPHALSAATAAQVVALILTGILVTPSVVARGGGLDAGATSWLIFAALFVSGIATILQAQRWGPVGGGTVLFVGSNIAFVGVCIAAISSGGISLMGTLVAVSALATFAFTFRLGALRRILTPAVGGTVLILMVLSVGPTIWKLLSSSSTGIGNSTALPITALATLLPILAISMFGSLKMRLWAPLIGVLIGSWVGSMQGLVNLDAVHAAPWVGLPKAGWPGLDLSFDEAFWSLLPAFILISLVGCIETYADSIASQRMAWREAKPIDFRAVQGSINADGVGSFMAGVAGTVPNTVYSTSVGVVELTGVAARPVAIWGGAFMMLLAFFPKVATLVTAMPNVVAGAYILVLVSIILGHGIRMITEEQIDFSKMLSVCIGIWVGTGFQGGHLFNQQLPASLQAFLSNGTTSGGITTLVLIGLLSLRGRRPEKRNYLLRRGALLQLRDQVDDFVASSGWDARARDKLMLVCEEVFLLLLEARGLEQGTVTAAKGRLVVRMLLLRDHSCEVEFICAPLASNLETVIAQLDLNAEPAVDSNLSVRLLHALAGDVKHLQYQGVDYLHMTVDTKALNAET